MKTQSMFGLALVLVASVASAQEPLDPMRLDPSLRGLTFGWNKEQVVSFFKGRVASQYEARIRAAADVRERDELTRESERAVAAVGTEWVAFDGKRSGWDVSVIKSEFAHDTMEEMLHERDGETHFYYFFSKGLLYKLVRTTAMKPAEMFAELERIYGKPSEFEPKDAKGPAEWKTASWSGGLLRLTAQDTWDQYRCTLIRWTLATAEDAVKAAREAVQKSLDTINPLVKQAKTPVSEEGDPVDAMIGGGKARPEPGSVPKPKKKAPKKQ